MLPHLLAYYVSSARSALNAYAFISPMLVHFDDNFTNKRLISKSLSCLLDRGDAAIITNCSQLKGNSSMIVIASTILYSRKKGTMKNNWVGAGHFVSTGSCNKI